ncbi:MAG: gephyrin-like molybdotransferase Glp [Phototrophicaceae bacterium]
MSDLMNVDVAIARILAQMTQLGKETIHITDSLGRVLAEDIVSSIDLPPFDNSAMDGFAIKAADSGHNKTLQVVMDIPAGTSSTQILQDGEAARIMTGAPIPTGADAVIPVEDTDADFSALDNALETSITLAKSVEFGAAIRRVGENIHQGQVVLTSGTVIDAAAIGMLASLGHSELSVIRRPRVAIVGSGDELVDIDAPLGAGQIRDSNSYALSALITGDGGIALRQAIAKDTPEAIRQLFKDTLAQSPDLIVSSAGVSVGAADYIKMILDELGEVGFWRINLRPGKPLAFGMIDGVPFFGLPGNPVSAMVTYLVLVRPALMLLSGKDYHPRTIKAQLEEAVSSDGRRTFARVQLKRDGDGWIASTTGTQSSGAHMSMVLADGLLIIPEGLGQAAAGTVFDVMLLKDIQ